MTSFLTTIPHDPLLDLDPWVGQRQATFRFERIDGVTGGPLGQLNPVRGANLTHDTTRTIKRQLNMTLGVRDTAAVNPINERVDVFMVFPSGVEYPMGRYLYTDVSREKWTSGSISSCILNDEMFLVDQEVEAGVNGRGINVAMVIQDVLFGLNVTLDLEPTPFTSAESWPVGTNRGSILDSLALSGDYFSPWFGNDGNLHFIRAFDPITQVPTMDLDAGNRVMRVGIVESDDLLLAPNRFVVISNAADDSNTAVVGSADVPVSAPHSIPNRGFVIQKTVDLQLTNSSQATAVAQNLAIRQTIFERVTLTTPPDPRHDSYDVIKWQDELWLELAWSMTLMEGGTMSHLLRKTYS